MSASVFRARAEQFAAERAARRPLEPEEVVLLRERHAEVVAWAGKLVSSMTVAVHGRSSVHPGAGGGSDRYYDDDWCRPVPAYDERGAIEANAGQDDYQTYWQLGARLPRGIAKPEGYAVRFYGVLNGYSPGNGPDYTDLRPSLGEWFIPLGLPSRPLVEADWTGVEQFAMCLAGIKGALALDAAQPNPR